MQTVLLDTLGKLWRHGHGIFGWCSKCGSPSCCWQDVRERRTPQTAMFDIDLTSLIRERGESSPVVGREPIPLPSMRIIEHGDQDHHTSEADAAKRRGRMSIIAWIILGLIAGLVASKIVNRHGEGIVLDIVIGVVGALIGGWIMTALGGQAVTGFNLYSILVAIGGATLLLVAAHAIRRVL
jgi:uncharacterized membrane protein YeaQ/YmgE (transglycosylase-associated protein family)